jgi:hypothetical protein
MELMGYGLTNVHIVDAARRYFTPFEFVQEMDIAGRTDEAELAAGLPGFGVIAVGTRKFDSL